MAETNTLELNVSARSDTGLKRKENQDRMTRFFSPFGEVFLIADGMGGHRGGAKAAAMVGDGMTQHLRGQAPDTPVEAAIRMATEKTNREMVIESRTGNPETAGMGATLVLVILRGNDAVIAHVGDSRAYLYREGTLRCLTRDHTRGREKLDAGVITEEQAFDHPDSSVLTRAFGHSEPLAVDIAPPLSLQKGDQLLLCSDGLCGYVHDSKIAEVLSRGLDARCTADELVHLANEAGGEDNVTVQVILAGQAEPEDKKTLAATAVKTDLEQTLRSSPAQPPRGGSRRLVVAGLIVLGLIAGLFALVRLVKSPSKDGKSQGVINKNGNTSGPSATPQAAAVRLVVVVTDADATQTEKLKRILSRVGVSASVQPAKGLSKESVGVTVNRRNETAVAAATKIHHALQELNPTKPIPLIYGEDADQASQEPGKGRDITLRVEGLDLDPPSVLLIGDASLNILVEDSGGSPTDAATDTKDLAASFAGRKGVLVSSQKPRAVAVALRIRRAWQDREPKTLIGFRSMESKELRQAGKADIVMIASQGK